MKEFNLSDKIYKIPNRDIKGNITNVRYPFLKAKDVKEFIKKLKEEWTKEQKFLFAKIDKLAGEELSK